MLTENFIAATHLANKPTSHSSNALKDVGVFLYEFQPQSTFRQGFKKSSVLAQGLATSDSHVFAAQADKAIINVYNRVKGNQEAIIPFPDKIKSIAYADKAATLVIGTEDGKLMLWEVTTGRISNSTASHLQPVSHLSITPNNDTILSGSADASVHVWSLSHLLSFPFSTSSNDDSKISRSPLRTFSNHRSAITALATGHSATATNFAVSVSADQLCYVWHLGTSQVLRAILLPSISLCATIDPADRAIYLGCENGTIQHIDLFGSSTWTSKKSIFEADQTAIQLSAADSWKSASDVGAAQSITLSYDGTNLLSGHHGGKIVRWDVAKHRTISEIVNLNQPVSCIAMLTPYGFRHDQPKLLVPNVVKPRLELGIQPDEGSLGIPLLYSIQAQVIGSNIDAENFDRQVCAAITGSGIPDSLVDDALTALLQSTTTGKNSESHAQRDVATEAQNSRLTEENEALKRQVNTMIRAEGEQRVRHLDRARRREALMKQRVDAFSAARKLGQDGDAAMKPYEDMERSIDIESEEEYVGNSKMEVDL